MDTQKLKIACVFEGELHDGGGFQTQLSTILEINEHPKYQIIAFTFSQKNQRLLESYGLRAIYVKTHFMDKILKILNYQRWFYFVKFKFKISFEKKLDEYHIDLVYFLSPSNLALHLTTHNYIFTIWDLCHRDTPEFPEVNNYREFERREVLYNEAPKKAFAVLTDSELGRKNAIKRYNLNEDRVFNVSFVPSINIKQSIYINVKYKYNIFGEYIYYPAQFWPHKNHIYILEAIAKLKEKGVLLSVIFSGADKGNLNYVMSYAKKLNIGDLVHYIGFAPNEDVYYLYKQSLALVMPSFFGPTNIPPLEAFAIGTPVIYSNIAGLCDQVGNAALLCDLKRSNELVEHLELLLNNPKKRIELIELGYVRLEKLNEISISTILVKIFDDYLIRLKCWKS
ncbi:glycosyltransferase [Acinetobacter bereziniae]|uniref:glycosyltransferase n=1 Tax=Acinetobacter bereziniae TaxID=106648 RepID=UPI00125FBEFE|nr:glycosyltransferase [Acinetobacter bereziniae]